MQQSERLSDTDITEEKLIEHPSSMTITLPTEMLWLYPSLRSKWDMKLDGELHYFCDESSKLSEALVKVGRKSIKKLMKAQAQHSKEVKKKTHFCKKTRERPWDVKFPFDLDFDSWIGSTAQRCYAKRKEQHDILFDEMLLLQCGIKTMTDQEDCTIWRDGEKCFE